MTPRRIQYEIRRRKDAQGRPYSQRRLAREWGYDEMSLSRCINKKRDKITAPLVHLISEFIEHDPEKVFPEYFRELNIQRPGRRKKNY